MSASSDLKRLQARNLRYQDDLQALVADLARRVAVLEHKTALLAGVSIAGNIERWFRSHIYLATMQFVAEMEAVEPSYSASAIRTALYRAAVSGRIVRVREGLYIEAESRS